MKRDLRTAANRCVLHVNKLEAFALWAVGVGYTREPLKGEFEVIRLKVPGQPVLIFFKRVGADHATCAGREARLVRRWIKARKVAA